MSTNYKTIKVELKKPLNNEEKDFFVNLSLQYSKEDIYFEFDDRKILTYLRTLNLVSFNKSIESFTGKQKIAQNKSPLFQIIRKIENIGSYGIKGKKRIFVDYNKERKVKNRKQKEKKRGIHYYAQRNTFTKENQPIPSTHENKIVCGDSEEVLKKLPDNCVDLVFTSPPYNFGLEYQKQDDDHMWEDYFDKLFKIFDECVRVLKYGGRIIVNVQPLFSDYVPSHHMISNFFISRKLIWRGEILWEKNNYNCKYTAWGSWKSPSNPYLKYTWEFLEIFCKGTLKKEGERENMDISADEFKKWVVSKWSIAPERKMKEYGHPAMFPEGLVERVLKLFSFRKDIILDPFNGVGTTSVVAKKLGRRYMGIDNSNAYCLTAKKRIKEGDV